MSEGACGHPHHRPPLARPAATAPGPTAGPDDAIVLEDVTFAYPPPPGERARSTLEGISLRIARGARLGVLGPNGGGKTTLLRVLLGLVTPQRGRVRVLGVRPAEARRSGQIAYVPQRAEVELAFPLCAREVVEMGVARGASPWRRLGPDRRERVREALELVSAADLADKPVGRLSGGQLQRVLIARAIAARPAILLLDEPTVGIDVAGQQRFARELTALHSRLGLTIVIVSHNLRAIAAGCDRVACLSRTLHSHTSPQGLTPEILGELFSHEVAATLGDIHLHAHPAGDCPDPSHAAAGGDG